MTSIAVLSAVAFVLAFFEFPVPLSPSFARMDLSDFPALIGAFAFGPVAGILIELVKNLLGLFSTATSGVGELANFLMGASFAATAGLIYVPIGKVSFGVEKLLENFNTVMEAVVKAKPAAAKGQYLRSIALSSTMGIGIKIVYNV